MPASTAALELLVTLKDQASKGMDDLAEKGGGLGGIMDGLGKGAMIAGGGVLALGGFLVGATKAAADEQVGIDRLGQTLKSNIPNWSGSEDAAEGFVTQMEKLAFSDDEARDSLNKLVPRTHDLAQAQKLSALAADLARAKNIDLSTATDIVGKVYGGNVGILGRYGIAVDKGATATEALAQIQKMAGGQAQVYANSAAGAADRIQTSLGDTLETLGHAILPAVTQAFQGFADWLSSPGVQAAIQALADGLANGLAWGAGLVKDVLTALAPVATAVWQGFTDLASVISGPLSAAWDGISQFMQQYGGAVFIGLAAAITGFLVPAFIAWAGAAGTAAVATLAAMVPVIAAAAPFIALGAVVAGLVIAFQNNFLGIQDAVNGAMSGIQSALAPFWNEIQPKLAAAWDAISSTAVNAWNWLSQTITDGVNTLKSMWDSNWGGIRTIVEGVWNFITGIVNIAWQTVSGIINIGLDALSGNWSGVWTDIQNMLSGVWDAITTQVLPGALSAIWTLISDFLPKLIGKLGEWAGAFMGWIMNDVVPNIPTWLGNIASALWTWLSTTAADLGRKLVQEWIPAFWNWITGPNGVLANLGRTLGQIASGIWNWITQTAKDAFNKVLEIGRGIVDGIRTGISNAWDSFVKWVMGLLGGIVDAVKKFFGIGSPSKLFADEIGGPMAAGIQQGFSVAWAVASTAILGQLSATWGDVKARADQIAAMAAAAASGAGVGSTQPPSAPGYYGGAPGNPYVGSPGGANNGRGGGGNMRTNAVGFGFSGGFAAVPAAGPTVIIEQLYVNALPGADGRAFASEFIEWLEEELSLSVRTRRGV